MPATATPTKIRLKVLRQKDQNSNSYWEEYEVPNDILLLVSKKLCEKHCVLPVSRAGTSLIVAMVDPKDQAALEELKFVSGFNIEPVIATERAIRSAVERYYKAM